MKQTLTFEIDVEQIAKELLDKEIGSTSYHWTIKSEVQKQIREQAVEQIKRNILQQVNETELVSSNYGKKYLTQLARDTITQALREQANNYIQKWIQENMKWVIERSLRETFNALIVPRLQKMIANMLIVDTESVDEQMRDLEQALKDEAKGAYETGKMEATKEIINSI